MLGFAAQRAIARSDEVLLALADRLDADGLLELEDEPRADRLDDRRRAALLAMLRIGQVDVLERVDVGDRAAAGHVGTRLRNSSRRATSTPGVPGPPMNLWGERKIASL